MIVGHIGGSGDTAIDTGDIQKSLRFAASRSTYLSRTFGTPTNQSKWTWCGWIKRGKLGELQNIFSRTINASANFNVYIGVDNTLTLMTSNTTYITTNQVFRDPTSWFHLGVIYDSANATPALRVRIYINNVEITSFSVDNRASVSPSQDSWNTTITGNIHAIMSTSIPNSYADCYLSRVCFVDGQALTPSSFGYQNTEINEWVSKSQSAVKAVVDAGGANSFMLDFDDGTSLTTLGYDKSSKGNNWTLNNHSLTAGVNYDWMEDVPGNSFATLNPLNKYVGGNLAVSNAGLDFVKTTQNTQEQCHATVSIGSGKYYWETVSTDCVVEGYFGLISTSSAVINAPNFVVWCFSSGILNNVGTTLNATSWGVNDVLGWGLDCDADTLAMYKNGSLVHTITSLRSNMGLSSGAHVSPYFWTGGTNNALSGNFNFGQRPFAYTPPTGFKALCQRNLPEGSSVTISGSFTGNAAVDGPCVWLNGSPDTLMINGNAVTFGTHADRLATGFKVRSSSASYNTAGSNTFVATITSNQKNCFKYNNAKDNS